MITYELKGWEEVRGALNALPQKIARNVLRVAVKKSGDPIKSALKGAAPVRGIRKYVTRWVSTGRSGTMFKDRSQIYGKRYSSSNRRLRYPGFLKSKIGNRYRSRKSGPLEVWYGIAPVGWAYYGYIVASGHIIGSRKSAKRTTAAGGTVGTVKAYDWISPVFQAMSQKTISNMSKNLSDGILAEGEKAGFKKSYGWSF